MKKNKKALSLVIAISITLVMSFLALYILEYMIPFSKNTKNIEQSVAAYYMADSAIEDWLYFINKNPLWSEKTKTISGKKDYWLEIKAMWQILPPAWEWNSEFDKNYNKIRIWEPIQIQIWNNRINPNNFKLYFKVPDLDSDSSTMETLQFTPDKLIHWQISGNWNTLNADWTQIVVWEINNSEIILKDRDWRDLKDQIKTFWDFYSNNCWTNTGCILKLSVINELKLNNWNSIPYLEWKIDAGSNIPLRYRIIKASWKSYWFQKNLKVRVPQKTLNQAYDFTVFQ